MCEEFGFLSVFGGRTNYPIVFDDLLIISAVDTGWGDKAPPAHRFFGLDKNTGEVRWYHRHDAAARRHDLQHADDRRNRRPDRNDLRLQRRLGVGVSAAHRQADLELSHVAARLERVAAGGRDDTIYMAQDEENLDNRTQGMLTAFKASGAVPADTPLDITKTATIWKLPGSWKARARPVLVDGRIYAVRRSGNLFVVDAKNGKKLSQEVKLIGVEIRSAARCLPTARSTSARPAAGTSSAPAARG